MRIDEGFRTAYRELEARMKALAETDGDVFLPSPEPLGPAHHILICMEPSLGRWARSREHAKSRVAAGFRNFLYSIEDFILHFCVRRYQCGPDQEYHMTDFSKGAMFVECAGIARLQRYDRWYALLQEEIDLCTVPSAGIVAVGNMVAEHLARRRFRRPFTRVIHYSGQAGPARRAGIAGHENSFREFLGSVSLAELVATAEDALQAATVPPEIRDETLLRLSKSLLTTSRQQLMFTYKPCHSPMSL